MIKYYYRKSAKTLFTLSETHRAGAVGVIEHATDADVQHMAEKLNLDVHDLIDIFDTQEIPRLEMLDNAALLFIRTPLPLEDMSSLETQLCMVVLARKKIWIATPGDAPYVKELFGTAKLTTIRPATVLLALLHSISRHYTQLTNQVSKKVNLTRQRFRQGSERDLEELLSFEAILNEYVSALAPMVQICKTLLSSKKIQTTESDEDLITEVLTNLSQTSEICLVNLKKIHALRDSFQIVFTNRLNHAVKILTAATIILTIPTMFASLFGMNVALPFSEMKHAFWLVVGIAVFVSVLSAVWFKRNKMI
jgi:magnesium transporter